MKQCPNCGLHNPDSATKCDCSYNFDLSELEDKSQKVDKGAWKWNVIVYVLLALGVILGTALAVVLKDKVNTYMNVENPRR